MKKMLVIGASRGIGLEFVRQSLAAGEQVTATARDEAGLTRLRALGATALQLDLLDTASCAGLAWQLDGSAFDLALINAGVYGPRLAAPQPPAQDDFDLVMRSNVLGPMRLLPVLAEHLAPGARLAVVSSLMGSMARRTNGNGWLYRASKAALNSVLKDASLLLAGRADGIVCVALHPGWVRTDMGGAEADLAPEESVANLRRLLAGLKPEHNGGFFNHDGEALPW